MKKRLRVIFVLAALTASGILIFQLYWVYNSYKTGEQNFNRSVLNALQKSVDAYPLDEGTLPSTLKGKSPVLSVMSSFSESPTNASKNGAVSGSRQNLYNVRFQPLSVSPGNLAVVQQMVAGLMAQTSGKPLRMDALSAIFKTELKKSDISLPFKLRLLQGPKRVPAEKIATIVSYAKDSPVVVAEPGNINLYLLKQNILPAAVSLVLVLLSAGSLYYMGFIIRRQMQLDSIKNDFINNITHELRTPISILKSTHEALFKFGEVADREKTTRYLKINTEILDKLDGSVDKILDIAKYEQGHALTRMEPIDLDGLIAGVITIFNAEKKASIKYLSEPPGMLQVTDKYIIEAAVTNLLDNAIKYSGEHVDILVKTSGRFSGWQLEIKDTGNGISEEFLPYIFDKFYRVPSGDIHDVKGFGLGLSFVKQLVTSINGHIDVKSTLNQGTTFTLQFPAYEQN